MSTESVGNTWDKSVSNPKISIIVPVFNQPSYTKKCFDSLREHTSDYELIVIDNGSTDGTAEYLQHIHDGESCIVLTNKENKGVTEAWNQGIDAALGDYLIFLNNDTILTAKWAENMVKVLQQGSDIYAVCPLSTTGLVIPEDFHSRVAEVTTKPANPTPGGLSGWCFALRAENLDEIFPEGGLFDKRMRTWYSDTDLIRRLYAIGHPPVQIENVLIHHFESRTLFTVPGVHDQMAEDAKTFAKKWNLK